MQKHCINSSSNKFWIFVRIASERLLHYNGNIFGNKCCRYNEGSLYLSKTALWGNNFSINADCGY